jgi:hypothetical protein
MIDKELFRRRRLPHWDLPGAMYFVTTCLEGSIPVQGLLDVSGYRQQLHRQPRPADVEPREWSVRQWKLAFGRVENWLDLQPGVRHFADARLANIVVNSLYHFAGERYDLLSYVVMPSHLHLLFLPRDEWVKSLGDEANVRTPRERIMHSLKRYVARECNLVLGRQGAFWQDESYDHCVVDWDEFDRINDYIEGNPVRAGLVASPEAWLYSSAGDRLRSAVSPGQPLRRPEGGAGL